MLLLGSAVVTLVALELVFRFAVGFNPGFYVGLEGSKKSRTIIYPYGKIIFNSDGFPDNEFLPEKKKPRVAYVGDSVCYGVGAGYGYRLSELLEKEFDQWEHMNMAFGVAQSLSTANINEVLGSVRKYKIDRVVYLLNLNDIMPNEISDQGSRGIFNKTVLDVFNYFRGKSYLFSFVVYRVLGSAIIKKGWFSTNDKVIKLHELVPEQAKKTAGQLVMRIKSFSQALKKEGAQLLIVILPYEMQISQEAERVYRELKVEWGEGFIDRGTQKVLIADLEKAGLDYVDAYYAFVDPENVEESRKRNKLGQYYVYNRGDRLDWNHPNREGHRLLAEYLSNQFKKKRFLN